MLKIILNGANGRIGCEIANLCKTYPNQYNLAIALVRNITDCKDIISSCAKKIIDNHKSIDNCDSDIIIDFSSPESSIEILKYATANNIPIVIGTTGFNQQQQTIIEQSSKLIPIIHATNTSLSVNVLFAISQFVANKLRDFEVEITEAHHRYKKDAPSGTAITCGKIIAKTRNLNFEQVSNFNRTNNFNNTRPKEEIGFSVIRGGDIVGRHQVSFINDGEVLSLNSEITNRTSFANGALIAAKWLISKPNGLYTMQDVLNLNYL